jgi:hypothetical protein
VRIIPAECVAQVLWRFFHEAGVYCMCVVHRNVAYPTQTLAIGWSTPVFCRRTLCLHECRLRHLTRHRECWSRTSATTQWSSLQGRRLEFAESVTEVSRSISASERPLTACDPPAYWQVPPRTSDGYVRTVGRMKEGSECESDTGSERESETGNEAAWKRN